MNEHDITTLGKHARHMLLNSSAAHIIASHMAGSMLLLQQVFISHAGLQYNDFMLFFYYNFKLMTTQKLI